VPCFGQSGVSISTVMRPILRGVVGGAPGDARLTGPGSSGKLDRWCHRLSRCARTVFWQ
jgi:hypothetical protein